MDSTAQKTDLKAIPANVNEIKLQPTSLDIWENKYCLKSKQGERIDNHDAVFRVNQAPTKYFERFAGKKTTLRVLNRKWTQIFNQKMGKGFLFADTAGASYVVTRARTTEFEHLAATVRKERDGDVKVFSMAHGLSLIHI